MLSGTVSRLFAYRADVTQADVTHPLEANTPRVSFPNGHFLVTVPQTGEISLRYPWGRLTVRADQGTSLF